MSLKFLSWNHVNIIPCYWIQYFSRFACEPEMSFRSGLCKRPESRRILTQSSLTCSSSHVKEQTHQPIVSLKVLYFNTVTLLFLLHRFYDMLWFPDQFVPLLGISKAQAVEGKVHF